MASSENPNIESKGSQPTNSPIAAKTITNTNKTASANTAPTPAIEYKIVRVKKPDGTIIRVKRPIQSSSSNGVDPKEAKNPSSTVATSESHLQSASGTSTEATGLPVKDGGSEILKLDENAHVARGTTPEISSKEHPSTLTSAMPKPDEKVAAKHSSSRSSSRLESAKDARAGGVGFKRRLALYSLQIHGHISRTVQTFDTDADIGDLESGDEDLSDTGHSTDNDTDDDSDNSTSKTPRNGPNQPGQAHENNIGRGIGGLPGFGPAPASGTTWRAPDFKPDQKKKESEKPQLPTHQEEVVEKTGSKPNGSRPQATHVLSKRSSRPSRYLFYFIGTVLPALFVVLGIMTAVLNGRASKDSHMGAGVSQAITVAVSAWPIVFAGIAAQSIRAFASYRAERGIRLMTLEQLMGSHSVASALKQPILLWRIDMLSIALLCLWSLSPIASQAMLRMLEEVTSIQSSFTPVYFMDTAKSNVAFGNVTLFVGGTLDFDSGPKRLYTASFLPPGQYQSIYVDAWGNPRIPVFEELDKSTADVNGWCDASNATSFSSSYGIPLSKFYDGQISPKAYDFTIWSTYLHFDCPSIDATTMEHIQSMGIQLGQSPSGTMFMAINPQNESSSGMLAFASAIMHSSDSYSPGKFAYAVCNFNQSFVDSQIHCDGSDCKVTKMRLSTTHPSITAMTNNTLSADFVGASFDKIFVPTTTERYIWDPDTIEVNFVGDLDLSQVSPQVFTKRLSYCVNTMWQVGFGPANQTHGLDPNDNSSLVVLASTTATVSEPIAIYATHAGWLATLFCCSAILLLLGLASTLWDSQTLGPDIFGFVSTIARRNRYIDLPKVSSTMDGSERARLMGNVRVMVQDVKPGAEVGRIGLGSVSDGSERLRLGRLYA